MDCCICGKMIAKGTKFQGPRYKNYSFCSEECYEKFVAIKSAPKPPVNYKPAPNTIRRKFTDYVQKITNDTANWAWVCKQAKDIQEEFELDWRTMLLVLRYACEYEGVEFDATKGLYQVFPRYIQPMKDFAKTINQFKKIDFEDDEIQFVKKPKNTIGKVEF